MFFEAQKSFEAGRTCDSGTQQLTSSRVAGWEKRRLRPHDCFAGINSILAQVRQKQLHETRQDLNPEAGLENHGQGTWYLPLALAKQDFLNACLAHFGCTAGCTRATKCRT